MKINGLCILKKIIAGCLRIRPAKTKHFSRQAYCGFQLFMFYCLKIFIIVHLTLYIYHISDEFRKCLRSTWIYVHNHADRKFYDFVLKFEVNSIFMLNENILILRPLSLHSFSCL